MKNKPTSINILGITYQIIYCSNPAEVDCFKRESLWGQVDFWTRTIRIYDNGRNITDIWTTIIHELLHAIGQQLKLDILDNGHSDNEQKHEPTPFRLLKSLEPIPSQPLSLKPGKRTTTANIFLRVKNTHP